MMVEWVKSSKAKLASWLTNRPYAVFEAGMNFVAIHETARCSAHTGKAGLSMKI